MPNFQVNYESGAAEFAQQLIGHVFSDEELANLAGALDGATVNVTVRQKKGWLYLAVDDPTRFEVYETSVRRDASGELYGYIHEVRVASEQRGQGLGAQALARQVAGARLLGLKRFELWAAGDVLDSSRNGYYTWARFGFDARLTSHQRSLLIHSLIDAETVNEVIKRSGQDWWKRYGCDASMVFDLSDGSAMMGIFDDYLREKGIVQE